MRGCAGAAPAACTLTPALSRLREREWGEHALSVRVDLFRQLGDACMEQRGQAGVFAGEGEGFEAAGFVVAGPVFQRSARRQRPFDVRLAGEHAQGVGILKGDGDQHVVRQDGRVQELEGAVLGGFDGGDVARQAGECGAQVFAWLAKQPPVITVGGAVIGIALRLHALLQPLVNSGVLVAQLLGCPAKGVYDLHAARPVGQVAAVAVGADQLLLAVTPALSQRERE